MTTQPPAQPPLQPALFDLDAPPPPSRREARAAARREAKAARAAARREARAARARVRAESPPAPRPASTRPSIIRAAPPPPPPSGVRAASPDALPGDDYERILQRLNKKGFLHDDDFYSLDALGRAFGRAGMDAVNDGLLAAVWETQFNRLEDAGAKVDDTGRGRRVTLPGSKRPLRPAAAARALGIPEAVADATPRPRMQTAARETDTGLIALAGGGAYKPRRAYDEAARRGMFETKIDRNGRPYQTIPGVPGAYRKRRSVLDALERAPRPR